MNTSLNHLSAGRRQLLTKAVTIIVKAVRPEKIILFGIYNSAGGISDVMGDEMGDNMNDNMGDSMNNNRDPLQTLSSVLGAFDLLVVTREEDRRSDYELQD